MFDFFFVDVVVVVFFSVMEILIIFALFCCAAENTQTVLFLFSGNPKPVYISHLKASLTGVVMNQHLSPNPHDVTYVSTPLYHSVGLIVSFGGALATGIQSRSCSNITLHFSYI